MSKSYETIDAQRSGRVLTIRFNRPKALNALNTQVMEEVLDCASAHVNGGVKFGHCGGAKVGQFGASALERAALI